MIGSVKSIDMQASPVTATLSVDGSFGTDPMITLKGSNTVLIAVKGYHWVVLMLTMRLSRLLLTGNFWWPCEKSTTI